MSTSKSSQSGLGSVRRNFSTTCGASEPKSSREAYLASFQLSTDRVSTEPLADSKLVNKRSSDSSSLSGIHATKKQRRLPSGYKDDDTTHTATTKGAVASVFLSQEQSQIKALAVEGEKSLFYTGSAGTGKSVLLREIIKALRKKHVKAPDAVAITASTGIAACNIGGVTIHSFAGIGLGIEKAEELARKVRLNKRATLRWLRTKILIIDEISMVEADLFDKLAQVGSIVRRNSQPFGGIQIIVTGDFFQLPPVTKNGQVKFAFEAECWSKAIKYTFNLTRVFRQRDQEFVSMLNEMRFGRLSAISIQRFKELSRPLEYKDGLEATELFPRREDVDRSNSGRISRLQTQTQLYQSKDSGSLRDPKQKQKILANFMAPETLSLRIDCQVMLIKNVDETLVNGSMGRVVKFVDPVVYSREQGQDVTIPGSNGTKKPVSSAGGKLYPVVEFLMPNGATRSSLVMPEVWKVELPDGEVQVSRTQVPLILAWAMSIHKSQGQTLERVKVDLARVFEKGQAYVALSRATSLEGLQVLHFDPRKVLAHPKVTQWSKTLDTLTVHEQ
ncbi:hypothetical protein AX15_004789 [Amanita polypyramis BW_CC]|nr:hypothetical protein AX15_004789 [Amanita polypyramis BW_CC]